MQLRLFWILSFFILTAAAAQPLRLDQQRSFDADGYVRYYEDINGTLTWKEAKTLPFRPFTQGMANFGFTRSVYWFRIDLSYDERTRLEEWWLRIAYPLLEYIDLYLLDPNGKLIKHVPMGALRPKDGRAYPLRYFVTDLPLLQEKETTLLLRIKTQSSMQLPLTIETTDQLLRTTETGNLRVGVYYGIFLIIFLYNAVFFVYTKDRNYLRYVFFLLSFILWQLSFDGIGREYIWPDAQWLFHHYSASFIALTAFFALYFSRYFLVVREYYPAVDRLIGAMMWLSIILSGVALFVPYAAIITYITATVSVVPVVLLATGIAVMRRGYRPARFYIVGWSSFLVGTIIFAFNKFDIIPCFYGVNHVQQIGSAVEMIFLSWALADRVHLLQREYIDKLNHLNETLSENVRSALDVARAKDRMYVQQSRLAAMGEMIEQIAHQWRQPLNNLALINQDLFIRFKFGTFNEEAFEHAHAQTDEYLQYLSKTIDDFRNFYKTDKTKKLESVEELVNDTLRLCDAFLKYANIKTTVELHTSRKVYLAKNEMIQVLMNLFKNAHDAIRERGVSDGEILVKVDDCGEGVQVSVEDNARGVPEEVIGRIFEIYFTTKDPDKGSGLGLYMSKYIIEESIGGSIRVENASNGARFVMVLPSGPAYT